MRRLGAALITLAAVLAPLPALAQHGHSHAPGAASDGHLKTQACLEEFEAVVREGRGSVWRSPRTSRAIPVRSTSSS